MDKTNDTESSSLSSLNSLSTVTVTDSTDHDNDIDNTNDNDMLVFENGTLLGAISCDSSSLILNNSNQLYNSNSNNKSNNNNIISKSQQNLTTNSSTTSKLSSSFLKPILIAKSMERISSSQYQNINNSSNNCNNNNNSTIIENVLCNTTTTAQPTTNIRILPNNNNNDNNNNSNNDSIICTNISNDLNTSLLDHNNYELDNNNLSVNNNCNNINNSNTSDNNSYIINMNNNSNQIDLLNSSQCSFESHHLNSINRSTLRTATQHNKSLVETVATTGVNNTISPSNHITPPKKATYTKLKSDQMQPHTEYYDSRYHPPQYTAIYFDAIGNPITSTNGGSGTILNGNNNIGGVTSTSVNSNGIITNYYHHAMNNRSYDNLNQIHHHQYITTAGSDLVANNIGISNDMPIDSNQLYSGGINIGTMDGNRNGGAVDSIIPRRRGCFRQWFTRPSLPFVIGVLALGGVACTLGGIVLGSTGLVEHSTQYLSAALLMIGIGVSLLVISGAIWRLSIPDEVENCPCFRHLETCRNCNSPYCGNRLLTTHSGYMYPEFQHRPPPPSYLTSLNECTVGLLFHHEVANLQRSDSIRISTPPPAYRSSQSLSVFVPLHATVSPSQRSLIPELSMITTSPSTPLNTTTISLPDLEQVQTMLSQSELNRSIELQGTLSQGSPNVMSTVHDNSRPLNKKNGLTHLSDITIE